ncbi:MAG: leucyl aminopeptidase [Pseudomonadota bacterium]|nr:leucyl aminopeptidase [Pseudomonadota bacterium]
MSRVQLTNPAEVPDLFRQQLKLCNVQEGETIVVLSDLGTRKEYVEAAFAAASTLKANIYEMKVNAIPSWTSVGRETVGACKGGVEALKAADLVLAMHVPLFTKWMHDVRASGTRVQMIIDHPDDLKSQMSTPAVKRATKAVTDRLAKSKSMRVTSPAGTDFQAEIGDYPSLCQWGFADEPGHFDHWGAGHCYTFPNEGKANGTVVAQPGDIVVLPYNRYITDEIRMTVEDGFIVKIEGGLDARLMNHWLDSNKRSPDDRDGHAISHIGFGTNPYCRWDCIALNGDDVDRSNGAVRGFAGNFLFSTGPNTQGGGTRVTKGHYDLPMKDCTVYLDNELIIEDGAYVVPEMIADVELREQV